MTDTKVPPSKAFQAEEDADLQDLLIIDEDDLSASGTSTKDTSSTKSSTTGTTARYYDFNRASTESLQPSIGNMISMACTLVGYFCMNHQKTSKCMTVLLVGMVMYVITVGLVNQTEEVGISHYDMSKVKSVHDFKVGNIDHWCIHGGDHRCKCEDPLQPTPRLEKEWIKAFQYTKTLLPSPIDAQVDIAFLGQAIVEVMNGRIMGQQVDTILTKHASSMFNKMYGSDPEGPQGLSGVALGLAGDSSGNILYRLQHGYLSNTNFDPYVWWIVIGMEDLSRWQCSEDVVIMGVLRIVEEIQKSRPNAKIVINSLFPMTKLRRGVNDASEFVDAERPSSTQALYARRPESDEHGGHHGRRLGKKPKDLPQNEWEKMSKDQRKKIAAMIAKKKQYEKEIKHDKKNPNMKDTHKMRSRDFFMRHRDVNLWPSVHTINIELKKFALENENVKFFDATEIFATPNDKGDGGYTLLTDKITPRGHPTESGYHDWLEAVKKNGNKLVKEQREKFAVEEEDDDYFKDFQHNDDVYMFGDDDDHYYNREEGSGDDENYDGNGDYGDDDNGDDDDGIDGGDDDDDADSSSSDSNDE